LMMATGAPLETTDGNDSPPIYCEPPWRLAADSVKVRRLTVRYLELRPMLAADAGVAPLRSVSEPMHR